MFCVIKERRKRCTSKLLPGILHCCDSGADLSRTDCEIPVFPTDPGCCDPWLLGCLHSGSMGFHPRWLALVLPASKMSSFLSFPVRRQGSAGELWVDKDPIRTSAAGDRCILAVILPSVLLCSSFWARNIWQNGTIRNTWGLVCVCSCPFHCQPNARNGSWKASSDQSVCVNRFPRMKWLFS